MNIALRMVISVHNMEFSQFLPFSCYSISASLAAFSASTATFSSKIPLQESYFPEENVHTSDRLEETLFPKEFSTILPQL
jgi:hypothetical protein